MYYQESIKQTEIQRTQTTGTILATTKKKTEHGTDRMKERKEKCEKEGERESARERE